MQQNNNAVSCLLRDSSTGEDVEFFPPEMLLQLQSHTWDTLNVCMCTKPSHLGFLKQAGKTSSSNSVISVGKTDSHQLLLGYRESRSHAPSGGPPMGPYFIKKNVW